MILRIFAALMVFIGSGAVLYAQQDQTVTNVGDHLAIRMSGDLAKEYAHQTGMLNGDEAPRVIHVAASGILARQYNDGQIRIEAPGTISQKLDDGRIRIEHTSRPTHNGETKRLVTLTIIVDPSQITTGIKPMARLVPSPAGKPKPTVGFTTTHRLALSDFKCVKLRSWTLSDEIGD